MGTHQHWTLLSMPQTWLGWWAIGVSVVFAGLFIGKTTDVFPFFFPGMLIMLLGVVAGILTLGALIWKHERSWLIWLMLLPGVFAIVFAVGELL